ncbi:TolC family protein [Pollutibacter soli]|uniref:TolC family protein n=1 Tax=Pollutibacter soli TaxID=3034157 RepID=UPI003013B25D
MRITVFGILLLTGLSTSTYAQNGDVWDLRRCIDYGMSRNISVRQADIQARISEVNLKEVKLQQIPSLNLQGSHSFNFGRNVNPTTNIISDNSSMNQNWGLTSQALLYNWGFQRNTISGNDFTYQADLAAIEKARNDIGLNIANQYLATLLQLEQANILEVQFNQTKAQYLNTRKLVDAGSVPELNAVELEAQMARDSAAMAATQSQYEINLLMLKALMTVPADTPFRIATPPIESIPVDNILETSPSNIYEMAMRTQPQIRMNNLRLKASEQFYRAAKSSLYPSIAAFAQVNTRFFAPFVSRFPVNNGFKPSNNGYVIDNTGNQLPLYTPDIVEGTQNNSFGQLWNGYGSTLNDNFGQAIGLSLNVPIFNGWRVKSSIARAKLDISSKELAIEQETLKLKQDIYTAYQNASGNYQTFIAREKAVKTAERSFELASKRYEYGVLQTIEWLTIQNNLSRARVDRVIAQYNYIFSMKVLEFYKGQGIRL